MILRYLLPFLYTHRYNRIGVESITYICEYYVSIIFLVALYQSRWESFCSTILSLAAFMLIYEIGYIENNVLAIKYENSPTIRHVQSELSFIETHFKKIVLIRYILAILLVSILSFLQNVEAFVILLLFTRLLFYLYNMHIRYGLIHRFLFASLRFLRFFSPVWFIGFPAVVFALIVSIVNLINNFAWYDRWGVQLPRFFGTKLFDALIYGLAMLFFYKLGDKSMSILLSYMAIIKLILFISVFKSKMRG